MHGTICTIVAVKCFWFFLPCHHFLLGIGYFLGADPLQMLNMLSEIESGSTTSQTSQPVPKNDEQGQFVSVVLADTEDVWN